jgi:hypothetical protein
MYMLAKAAMQFVFTAVDPGVVGHCATWRLEPAKPPMRVWTSHMPEGEEEVEARFH